MELNEETRHYFIRDYKLPIQIVKDEYFFYYLDLYQPFFKTREKYEKLKVEIENAGGMKNFINETKKVKDEALLFIKSKEGFDKFKNDNMSEYKSNNQIPKKNNLYRLENKDKIFVSIDLVKANVQVLNFYDKEILGNSEKYEDFLLKFTKSEYIIQSKQIRQVIFGLLEPKKQKIIQKYIMGKVKDLLIKKGMSVDDISFSSPDEIVFELKNFPNYKKVMKLKELSIFDFHIEEFELKTIKDDIPIYIKKSMDGSVNAIKQGSSKTMPEVIKYLTKQKLIKKDLAFLDEGRISFYDKPFLF